MKPDELRQAYFAALAHDLENFSAAPAKAIEAEWWVRSSEPDFEFFAKLLKRFGPNPTFGDMMTLIDEEQHHSSKSTTDLNPTQENNAEQ